MLFRSDWKTASDIWSVGVFTYQLLTGSMPFTDFQFPNNPRISQIWRSILNDEPKFQGSKWENVSQDAKDFTKLCLAKAHHARPSAKDCLMHKWLTQTDVHDRFKGKSLDCEPFKYETSILMKAQTINTKSII